jgi:hypothetical protein
MLGPVLLHPLRQVGIRQGMPFRRAAEAESRDTREGTASAMTNPQPGPPDPFGPMAESAVQPHQVFRSYVDAGFTEQQAIYLTGQILAASIRGPSS